MKNRDVKSLNPLKISPIEQFLYASLVLNPKIEFESHEHIIATVVAV